MSPNQRNLHLRSIFPMCQHKLTQQILNGTYLPKKAKNKLFNSPVKQRYLQTELQCDQIYLALIQQFGITNNNPDEDGGTALVTR